MESLKKDRESLKELIFQKIGEIAPEADPEELDPNEDLREALDIDSFDQMTLLSGLEEELGIKISESEAGEMDTLEHMLAHLEGKVLEKE